MFMPDCLFCKIINNTIPCSKVHEDAFTFAFNDINPQAPVHILVLPKEHYAGIHEIPPNKSDILKKLFEAVQKIVLEKGLIDKGYRLVVNFGAKAGQSVDHIHVHVLSGRDMHWPPG
jgi:Diadenosine tetraphosphate (Ap4A) hydrolase and other HIT family hydrolases